MSDESPREKSSQVALVLSGLLPGLGQLYNKDWAKGGAIIAASLVIDALILPEGYGFIWDVIRREVPVTLKLYVRILALALFRIWAVIDAERSVRQKNAKAAKNLKRA